MGNTTLSIISSDQDNGDGNNDGAIFIDGQSATTGQGAIFTFGGTMTSNEQINITSYTFSINSSFVSFGIQYFPPTNNDKNAYSYW